METKKTDANVLEIVESVFTDKIPFNRLLGLSVESIDEDQAKFRFDMRQELIGNYIRRTLHGGVISSTLDVTGGMVAFLGVLKRMRDSSVEEKMARFSKLGTIDLRIDYLRPGLGQFFVSSGFVLRTGSRVAVTRMELHNDERNLIAVGTGTYIVG